MKIFNKKENTRFENIWIKENVKEDYGASHNLNDTDYINYHIWEDINCMQMYKKYLSNACVLRGQNPNIIFHGGCLGCLSQKLHSIDKCKGCRYFKADWKKPNLFIKGESSSKMNQEDIDDLLSKIEGID